MDEEKTLASQIRDLGVGQSIALPYKSLRYIRNLITYLNGCEDGRYMSRSSVKSKTVVVTRTN